MKVVASGKNRFDNTTMSKTFLKEIIAYVVVRFVGFWCHKIRFYSEKVDIPNIVFLRACEK
jgi:hypothetical protein